MIRREKIVALVLSRRDIGEADRLVTLLTREYGLIRVVAKGVRKIPSRRGGHIEPFTKVLAVVSGSSGRYFLAAVETLDYFKLLQKDVDALERSERLAQIIVGLFEEEEAQMQLYDALKDAWSFFPKLPVVKRSLLELTITLMVLRQAGLMPNMTACLKCGVRRPDGAVVLDSEQGGWLCLICYPMLSRAVTSVTARGLKLLRFIARWPEKALTVRMSEEESKQVTQAIRLYVEEVVSSHVYGVATSKVS